MERDCDKNFSQMPISFSENKFLRDFVAMRIVSKPGVL